jgi:hypothetical protein
MLNKSFAHLLEMRLEKALIVRGIIEKQLYGVHYRQRKRHYCK